MTSIDKVLGKCPDLTFFEEEALDGSTSGFGVVEGKVVGVYNMLPLDFRAVSTGLEIFDREKGYARQFILHITKLLRERKAWHAVALNPDAYQKLTHIFKGLGYEEDMPMHFHKDYRTSATIDVQAMP